eukprot:Hpha_TRINITY_DN8113_c0_g1::TRINITY_DN8113_c0_g1_i2::g.171966::m.171966
MRSWAALLVLLLAFSVYFFLVTPLPPPTSGAADGRVDMSFYQQRPWFDEAEANGSRVRPDGPRFPLEGTVGLVTGSSSGIGRQVAEYLYSKGGSVVVLSRSEKRSSRACGIMKADWPDSPGECHAAEVDLSSFEAVRGFAAAFLKQHKRLDFLNANAGMGGLLGWDGAWLSKDGYEMLYASNYLGQFLLMQLLLPLLKQSGGRVAATSSIVHWLHDAELDTLLPSANKGRSDADAWPSTLAHQYGNTKLLQVLMCFEMQRREPAVPCTPVAPGFISTAIMKAGLKNRDGTDGWFPVLGLPSEKGARPVLQALLGEEGNGEAKGVFIQPYYSPPHRSAPWSGLAVMAWEPFLQRATWGLHRWIAHPDAYNTKFAARVWEESMAAVGLSEA